ncbi:MAG: PIN domain-containing protein [Rhodothermales bacterium]|nr:PIN domain-containing protein [Rhodothermales bacterium]
MRIYLDTCSLQRPLDDRSQLRIRQEAEAILYVLERIHSGTCGLVSSEVLDFEIAKNPDRTRLDFASETVSTAEISVLVTAEIEKRARELNQKGVDTLDSLHLACAEAGGASYFCTSDDALLRKAKRELTGVKAVSPLELAQELELWESR